MRATYSLEENSTVKVWGGGVTEKGFSGFLFCIQFGYTDAFCKKKRTCSLLLQST